MKEDNKPSNIACASFVPHRFKATQCGRCFKSHVQHRQFMKGNKNSHAQIMDLDDTNHVAPNSSSDEDSFREKLVILNGRNSLIADESGEISTEYYAPDSVMNTEVRQLLDGSDTRPRRQIPRKSAARRTREASKRALPESWLKLNIPIGQTSLNNLSLVSDAHENKEGNEFDSVSDNGSENNRVSGLFTVFKHSGNGRISEDEKILNTRDSAGIQYLKAVRASGKSSIPISKTARVSNWDSIKLQEFQKVARNLRHVANPKLDLNKLNENHCQALSRSLSVSDSDTSLLLNRQDLEERQRTIEAKTTGKLANTAYQTFSSQWKHDTLPRNLGTVVARPSIVNDTRHQRQTSDPEVFLPLEKEEIQVVPISTTESSSSQGLTAKKQVVRSSKISSEIFFGISSSSGRKQSNSRQNENSQEVIKTFSDYTEKPVMIVAADGSISHYRGLAETSLESNDSKGEQQRKKLFPPRQLTKPYRVVDVLQKPPEHPPDFDILASPKLPLSPSPRYKSSDMTADVDSRQDSIFSDIFLFEDSKFPKRTVALVEGMQAMKDGVQLSKQNSEVAARKDLKSPLSETDGDITPSFPILLSGTESETSQKSDKRRLSNSSNYKVPIFFSPKNYDNVGTVLSDMESAKSDLSKDAPGMSGEESYGYLTPLLPIKEIKQVDTDVAPVPPVRTTSDSKLHLSAVEGKSVQLGMCKKKVQPRKQQRFKEQNSNNSQSSDESHWRSKTHPLGEEPLYAKVNVQAKKSSSPVARSNTDVGKSKQKRVAPQPPNGDIRDASHVLPDSLPRGLPPPPPNKEIRGSGEIDLSEAPPVVRSGKPEAPTSPTEAKLRTIYEAMDCKPIPIKPAHNDPTTSSAKPLKVTSGSTVESTPKQTFPLTQIAKVQSPTQKQKSISESKGRNSPPNSAFPVSTLPRPMSPPVPCTRVEIAQLPDSSMHPSPNTKETKSKKSKLPWKRRRKRDDRGSPDRGFDATVVEKWLEGVYQLRLKEDAQRNSMDRLEVINAYRGEQTAFIDHSDLQLPSLSTSPEQNGEESDGSGVRMRANSSSKRRAPKPPMSGRPASWVAGTLDSPSDSTEDFLLLRKSSSLSPRSRRRASDGDTLVQYENIGVLCRRQKRNAPPKPERRRRNMTTGFENLPSNKESNVIPPGLIRQTSSDPDFTKTFDQLSDTQPIILASASPLKSALKTPRSFETKKADIDAQAQPKRPVRIIAPQKSSEKEPSFVNIYSNIEIKQRGLGTCEAKKRATSVMFTIDAETQCAESSNFVGDSGICKDILDINRMTLARLAVAARGRACIDGVDVGTMRPWEESHLLEDQPCCTVLGGAFYKVAHPQQENMVSAVMIGTDTTKASALLHVAQCIQMISAHPNVVNICHASIEPVPGHMLKTTGNQSKVGLKETSNGQNEDRVETAVVVTDKAPVTHIRNYVSHKKEMHEYLPEKYEHNVALLLLQVLQGLQHLQMHRVYLRSLKSEDLLLVDSSLPGGGSLLQINLLMSHLQQHSQGDSPGDIYGLPEQLEEKMAEFDVGLLVYEFLHRTNPFAVKTSLITQEYAPAHLPPIPARSRYSQGLGQLAGELLRKSSADRLGTSQAINMLQCLLWGPIADLLQGTMSHEQALHEWLATEQARKVASMCQYCIPVANSNDTGYSLADQLHCQFLSDTSVQSLSESMKLLYQ